MLFKYPKIPKEIYKFEIDEKQYVADLESGDVIEIDEVIWEVLDLCSTYNLHEIINRLGEKYKESQIFEAVEKLDDLWKRNLIFYNELPHDSSGIVNGKRLKLFVPFDFLERRMQLDPKTNFGHYHLLTALAKVADIYIAVPSDKEQPKLDFGEVGIHTIPVKLDKIHSPVRFIPDACDGILLLSQHPYLELPYFRGSELPVVCCIEGDRKMQPTLLELAFNSYSALKKWDILCLSSSWLKEWLCKFEINPDQLCVIPNGVDTKRFKPMEKRTAKRETAKILENADIMEKPIIGIISGLDPDTSAHIALKLARLNPHLMFLVYDSSIENLLPETPDNLHIFGVEDFRDKEILPMIFNAFDLFCFAAIPGTDISSVLEALACGIPSVVIGIEQLPEEVDQAGILVKAEIDKSGKIYFSIKHLSEAINDLLENTTMILSLTEAAQKKANLYGWDRTAKEIVNLFVTLHDRKTAFSQHPKKLAFPIIFSLYYDKPKGVITSRAFRMANSSHDNLEEGIATALLEDHNMTEVKSVLKHICQDQEKVDGIIRRLIELYD